MRLGLIYLLLCLLSVSAEAQKRYTLGIHFEDCPQPPVPDYNDQHNWAALPGVNDPSDKVPAGIKKPNEDSLLADVFFVHPTIYTYLPPREYKWNGDVHDADLNRKTDKSTIQYQASVFNAAGKVYAPRYRQAHISAFYVTNKKDGRQALDLAYTDVKAAFQYYLDNYNHGRPIIIASHSQGTVHAVRLLQEYFDGKPLQKQLVAAYLVGMPVPADSFCCITPCRSPGDTACWLSWNTFATGFYPPYYKGGLNKAICTNPLTWTTDSLYCAGSVNAGGILRDFNRVLPNLSDAEVHEGMLWVHRPRFKGSWLYNWKIYHVVDYNLFYMNIRENALYRVKVFTGR